MWLYLSLFILCLLEHHVSFLFSTVMTMKDRVQDMSSWAWFIFFLHNNDYEGQGSRRICVLSPRYVFFGFSLILTFIFRKSYMTTASTSITITLVAPCCHGDDNGDKGWGSRQCIVFKSPVLWTGKKLDLDWTELKKTRLSVVVCHSFKSNRLWLRGLWGKKNQFGPVRTGPNRFYYVYISSYNNRINIYIY